MYLFSLGASFLNCDSGGGVPFSAFSMCSFASLSFSSFSSSRSVISSSFSDKSDKGKYLIQQNDCATGRDFALFSENCPIGHNRVYLYSVTGLQYYTQKFHISHKKIVLLVLQDTSKFIKKSKK